MPKGTVSEWALIIYFEMINAIIDTGEPRQQIAKKNTSKLACGIPIRRTANNLMSPAPITPTFVNKKPNIMTTTGIKKLIRPKKKAIPMEHTKMSKTQ